MKSRVLIHKVKHQIYYKCPHCKGGHITEAFNRCIDCHSIIEWVPLKKEPQDKYADDEKVGGFEVVPK